MNQWYKGHPRFTTDVLHMCTPLHIYLRAPTDSIHKHIKIIKYCECIYKCHCVAKANVSKCLHVYAELQTHTYASKKYIFSESPIKSVTNNMWVAVVLLDIFSLSFITGVCLGASIAVYLLISLFTHQVLYNWKYV